MIRMAMITLAAPSIAKAAKSLWLSPVYGVSVLDVSSSYITTSVTVPSSFTVNFISFAIS